MSRKAGFIRLGKKNIHFIHLILMGFGLFVIIYGSIGSVESAYIAKVGIETEGEIIDVRKVGSKGNREFYYQFSHNNRIYKGRTLYLSKKVGDKVSILFIADNPQKNRVLERLKKTYNVFLKNNPNLE